MTSFRRFQTIQMLPFQEACIPLPRFDAQSSRCVREAGEAEQFRSCKKPAGGLIPSFGRSHGSVGIVGSLAHEVFSRVV